MTESEESRILIVEDRKTQTEVIHFYLTEEGYEITWQNLPLRIMEE